MPWAKCSICGILSHLNIGKDPNEWMEKMHPTLPKDAPIPARCYYCFREPQIGETVIVRDTKSSSTQQTAGSEGTLKEILRNEEGLMYRVMFGKSEVFLARFEFKIKDN